MVITDESQLDPVTSIIHCFFSGASEIRVLLYGLKALGYAMLLLSLENDSSTLSRYSEAEGYLCSEAFSSCKILLRRFEFF